jgi:hypothetical protein
MFQEQKSLKLKPFYQPQHVEKKHSFFSYNDKHPGDRTSQKQLHYFITFQVIWMRNLSDLWEFIPWRKDYLLNKL